MTGMRELIYTRFSGIKNLLIKRLLIIFAFLFLMPTLTIITVLLSVALSLVISIAGSIVVMIGIFKFIDKLWE